MRKLIVCFLACIIISLTACKDDNRISSPSISSLRFIGEQIIPYNLQFENTTVGGLSAIDYANNTWYLLSDDKNSPRFYTASINYDATHFNDISLTGLVTLLNTNNQPFNNSEADPEAMRIDLESGKVIWTSEGDINKGINPFIREASISGQFSREFELPNIFQVSTVANHGPRNNSTFESISLAANKKGYWTCLEEPLKQDGDKASFFSEKKHPVRISYLKKEEATFNDQYAYQIDKVARKPIPNDAFSVNGVVEILAVDEHYLLVMERSYSVGYTDGGNNIKVYLADLSTASEISTLKELKTASYQHVKKTLLFDFEDIRDQLSQQRVDNIEGMAFGPDLPNGHRTIVMVSDNNFNPIQITQLIAFEVIP